MTPRVSRTRSPTPTAGAFRTGAIASLVSRPSTATTMLRQVTDVSPPHGASITCLTFAGTVSGVGDPAGSQPYGQRNTSPSTVSTATPATAPASSRPALVATR